jgi:6-phosphogluconolactonase
METSARFFGSTGWNSFDNSSIARVERALEMKNFELISFASADELAQAAAGAWLDEIETANRAGKTHCVALSGGRIAQKFFASTVEYVKARKISFISVHFFWADERCVPPDDVESNFCLAKELLFAPLKIGEAQIHRIHGELPPDKAAELAMAEIRRVTLSSPSPPQKEERDGMRRPIVSNSNPLTPTLSPLGRGEGVDFQPILDLIFLGMGEDGHVASLFPNASAGIVNCDMPFLAVENSPKPPSRRISMSYAIIAAAKQVCILASGAGKEATLRESLEPDGHTPLARVIHLRPHTKIFTDIRLGQGLQPGG